MDYKVRQAQCDCGQVTFEAYGEPIISAICYCADCQSAGKQLENMSQAKPICQNDGGTAYLTFRQDRWHVVKGEALIEGFTLSPQSPTTRFITTCCQSAMFLKYSRGFWISVYRNRFAAPLPPLEWRNKVAARKSDLPLDNDIPNYKGFPIRLFGRLIKARTSMFMGR